MKALAHARQVAMYLSRKLTKSSFPEIGQKFNKDHSTVISAVRKVEQDVARACAVSDVMLCLLKGRATLAGASNEVPRDRLAAAYFGE